MYPVPQSKEPVLVLDSESVPILVFGSEVYISIQVLDQSLLSKARNIRGAVVARVPGVRGVLVDPRRPGGMEFVSMRFLCDHDEFEARLEWLKSLDFWRGVAEKELAAEGIHRS